MGNSGSNDLQQHGHLPREYLKHYRDVAGGGGHQNFRRQASHQQLPAPIKVLPDPGGARLRPTNNGNILQSGGTLTGKKLYRSQSISATHQNPSPGKATVNPPYLMQRSQTLLHFGERRPTQDITNYQGSRYGSQPELRADDVDHGNGGGPVSLATATNKYSKMKKMKKPAPQAPQKEFEPSRHGWRQSPAHQQSFGPSKQEPAMNLLPPAGAQGRKMRLFKTKAESKKTSPTNRQSAMDGHHNQEASYLPEPKRSPQHHRHEEQFQSLPFQRPHVKPTHTATQERKPSFPKVSLFRREKSFDITLMQNQNRPKEMPAARTSVRRQSPEMVKRPTTTLIKSKPSPLSKEPEKTVAKPTFRKPSTAVQQKQPTPKPAQLPTTDFQKELLLATRRRSTLTLERLEKAEAGRKEVPKPKTEPVVVQAKITEVVKKEEKTVISVGKTSTVSKEASPKPQDSRKVSTVSGGETKPAKSFYFGMDKSAESKPSAEPPMNKEQLDLIDRFAESILNKNKFAVTSQESAISSETASLHSFLDTEADKHEISLNLRPTLPRKQFEIPRFSPVAAWRLLTAEDESKENTTEWYSNVDSAVTLNLQLSNDQEEHVHDEERIERIYREPIPGLQDNKSGDSGISGEMADEPSQQIAEENPLNNSYLSAWTPQQDLGEDDFEERAVGDSPPLKDFAIKGHIFSLTLPREHHLSDKPDLQAFHSLQKMKRTSHNESETSDHDHVQSSRNDNWFLSRSGHNSLEINGSGGGGTLMRDHTGKAGGDKKIDTLGSLTSGKHVMYLPNRDQAAHVTLDYSMESRDPPRRDYVDEYRRGEDEELDEEEMPDDVDNDKSAYLPDVIKTNVRKISKSRNYHRFTFQSTVRQVERRQIADKLSREAEEKEAQRLSELEAMQRVEEEFQKKRAREKASIRHQLRIFSLEEGHQSMPDWEINNERVEPEGAVSSPSPSPRPSSPAPAFTNMFKRPTPMANDDQISDDYRDSKTPYIKRIVEEKSSKNFQRTVGDRAVKENTSSKARKTNEVQITNATHSDKVIQIMGWSDRHQAKHYK